MDPLWLGVIIPVAVVMGTVLAGLIQSRESKRTSGGKIGTSQADDLWEQTRAITDGLRRDKERAEDQRDRLLDLQETQIMPALEAITKSQAHVLGVLTELAGRPQHGVGE